MNGLENEFIQAYKSIFNYLFYTPHLAGFDSWTHDFTLHLSIMWERKCHCQLSYISLLLSTKSIRFVVLEILLLLGNELFAYLKLKLGIYTWNIVTKGIGLAVLVCTLVSTIWKTEVVEKCMKSSMLKIKLATHLHTCACSILLLRILTLA